MTAFVTANNIPSGTAELTLDELNQVAGGTFTINTYSKSVYHSVGISTRYNFLCEDEFMFIDLNRDGLADLVKVSEDTENRPLSGHSTVS